MKPPNRISSKLDPSYEATPLVRLYFFLRQQALDRCHITMIWCGMTSSRNPKIIILDDDPTGSQTVHSCLLLTRWDVRTLQSGLADESPIFFILTNTRALPPQEAASVTREVCRNLTTALVDFNEPWIVVSRSDSTLRGHYPVETDVISEELGPFDAHFLVPAFFEGGRITRDAVHYVVTDGIEIPAHETPFARDAVFGYSTAYLPDYVAEKTGGRIPATNVALFGPEVDGAERMEKLEELTGNACCAVSAETQAQLDEFARASLVAARHGKRFLFRSAASLLTSLAALPPQPVPPQEMAKFVTGHNPGLVLVGSHVPLSTRQLKVLLAGHQVEHVEIEVSRLPADTPEIETEAVARLAAAHAAGKTVVISTSRTERVFPTSGERLEFGIELSALLMRIVQQAPETLGFIVSKGGITSNDVLSTGLALRKARVVGQIHPGCSVVLTPPDHRFGSIPVVIFPGNVGTDVSLGLVYERLTQN